MNKLFYKYQGTGNDFILFDDREGKFPARDKALIARLCHRRFGIGADGLILFQITAEGMPYMQYFNSDGAESTMCGNGGRCFSRFLVDLKAADNKLEFLAIDGPHQALVKENALVSLQMKNVDAVEKVDERTFVLNTGSPHYVKFINQLITTLDVVEAGRSIRYSERFAEQGINVNFVQKMEDGSLAVRTYERGVEDETYSCGTGVTAAAIALSELEPREFPHHAVRLGTPGGALRVSYQRENGVISDVWLEGPAVMVFQGVVELPEGE
ncbi:MAG: diaminopimelate epimerase [Bacteroidia bacterium]|nr:diaminopimelate epimerase [Bacteroidia bacterium]